MNRNSLNGWEKIGLVLLLLILVGLGWVTLMRSAWLPKHRTDADVYFRAAWALRVNESPYRSTDTNGWHYHYPPPLAIFLMPLADPPHDQPASGGPWMPYPVSILLWYALNGAALFGAVHVTASAIESITRSHQRERVLPGGQQWWRLRVWPVLICFFTVGYTLSRGQVNLLLALAWAGACGFSLQKRHGIAGCCLAGGVCLKPFLLIGLLIPLIRREKQFFTGFFCTLLILLLLLPIFALGPHQTMNLYNDWYFLRLRDMVTGGTNSLISSELDVLRGNFTSWGAVWYKTFHPDPAMWPAKIPASFQIMQTTIGIGLAGITLVGLRRRLSNPIHAQLRDVLVWGALIVAILPSVSTCKPHYYALALLLAQGLIASQWEIRRQGLPISWLMLFVFVLIGTCLSEVPQLVRVTGGGLIPYAMIILWAMGIRQIHHLNHLSET